MLGQVAIGVGGVEGAGGATSCAATRSPRCYARCQKQTEAFTSWLNQPLRVSSPATYLIRHHLLAKTLHIPS
jgi:hypothetical protein